MKVGPSSISKVLSALHYSWNHNCLDWGDVSLQTSTFRAESPFDALCLCLLLANIPDHMIHVRTTLQDSPFSQIYGLSPCYYWWQNPEVVRPADFRRIVIEYRTSPLSSLPMQYWNKGVCPVGSWWANTHLRRVSGELMVIQYSTMEGVLWAHGRPIHIFGGCPVSSWWANTQPWRVTFGLMVDQYCHNGEVIVSQYSYNVLPICM